ncbi:hypothetical protein [Microcoleus sp. D3_18a_C4]|uniref:hypothetical protein n=1 Tax=Microcoleus sp. D3_18a_C4 TaxID=3055332 RepID=UPI00403FADF1
MHPFNDGNGRRGRLLATAEVCRFGYRMRELFSFDKYFNADRGCYYRSLHMRHEATDEFLRRSPPS